MCDLVRSGCRRVVYPLPARETTQNDSLFGSFNVLKCVVSLVLNYSFNFEKDFDDIVNKYY